MNSTVKKISLLFLLSLSTLLIVGCGAYHSKNDVTTSHSEKTEGSKDMGISYENGVNDLEVTDYRTLEIADFGSTSENKYIGEYIQSTGKVTKVNLDDSNITYITVEDSDNNEVMLEVLDASRYYFNNYMDRELTFSGKVIEPYTDNGDSLITIQVYYDDLTLK